MLNLYQLPRINDQFKFEKSVKEAIKETSYAFDIDSLDGWQINILIQNAIGNESIRRLTFCSKQTGKLYAIGMSFKYSKLWFIDTQKKYELTERIADINFLTVARY